MNQYVVVSRGFSGEQAGKIVIFTGIDIGNHARQTYGADTRVVVTACARLNSTGDSHDKQTNQNEGVLDALG